MDGNSKILYAFRGWIGFIAFMDLGTTIRSFIEKKSFLSKTFLEYDDEEFTTSRILGIFALLKAVSLIYTTLYIYCKPVVDLGKWALMTSVLLYLSESIYFRSVTLNVTVIFPLILNLGTLFALFYLPVKLRIWEITTGSDDEGTQLFKEAPAVRRKKSRRV
ncbi:uncharacterized protein LOC132703640 [Cylas formicarius]|uniref:uncharacterized protein LOC132703640 n=1 Tax=Cylas formicarius TaxID=197179 RepID=UPI00295859D8|nr:uncharacterized protein LOC132703640 [Cylas formicarius]